MNNRNINCRTTIPALLIALAFTCISSVTAQVEVAGERGPEGAVVGLWQVHYTSVACDQPVLPPEFFTYQQFHSDGLKIETPIFAPGVCMGAWRQMGHMVQIHHVGWTPGGIPGFPQIVRFVFTETITVGHDRNSLDGTLQQTFYDAPVGGNVVAQCTATTHATRISVP
jgi:hypothetical protein